MNIFDQEDGVKLWVDMGAPKEKLILGVPFYGHAYTLKDPNQHGLNAPIVKEEGQWPYHRVRRSIC